jgi:hypothetical protein
MDSNTGQRRRIFDWIDSGAENQSQGSTNQESMKQKPSLQEFASSYATSMMNKELLEEDQRQEGDSEQSSQPQSPDHEQQLQQQSHIIGNSNSSTITSAYHMPPMTLTSSPQMNPMSPQMQGVAGTIPVFVPGAGVRYEEQQQQQRGQQQQLLQQQQQQHGGHGQQYQSYMPYQQDMSGQMRHQGQQYQVNQGQTIEMMQQQQQQQQQQQLYGNNSRGRGEQSNAYNYNNMNDTNSIAYKDMSASISDYPYAYPTQGGNNQQQQQQQQQQQNIPNTGAYYPMQGSNGSNVSIGTNESGSSSIGLETMPQDRLLVMTKSMVQHKQASDMLLKAAQSEATVSRRRCEELTGQLEEVKRELISERQRGERLTSIRAKDESDELTQARMEIMTLRNVVSEQERELSQGIHTQHQERELSQGIHNQERELSQGIHNQHQRVDQRQDRLEQVQDRDFQMIGHRQEQIQELQEIHEQTQQLIQEQIEGQRLDQIQTQR